MLVYGRITIARLVGFFLRVIIALWIVSLILSVGGLFLFFFLAWLVTTFWS